MSDKSAFPLDAEQIVRLTGAALTRLLNAGRHPDLKPISQDDVILGVGDAAGVALPTEQSRYYRRLLPYGSVSVVLKDEGGVDANARRHVVASQPKGPAGDAA